MKFIQVRFGKTNKMYSKLILLYIGFSCLVSCIPGIYTFNGTTFDPAIETFYIGDFEVKAQSVPPLLDQTFEETLKLKIRRESRLSENDVNPDIEFKGTITKFDPDQFIPGSGEEISGFRMSIDVRIEYIDNINEERNWEKTFTQFADYGQNQNLLDVQDQLVTEIFDQIVEDIFNFAFTDW